MPNLLTLSMLARLSHRSSCCQTYYTSYFLMTAAARLNISELGHSSLKPVATLGFILDSQLSWESGKFQLARWSHEVVIFSDRTGHPATQPPDHMDVRLAKKMEFDGCLILSILCGVPTPIAHHINKVCAVSPPPRICFSPT